MLPRDPAGAAFREFHGARLHGFALLVSLGDRELAARTATAALARGAARASQLQEPDRAANLLRAKTVELLRRSASRRRVDHAGRRAALRGLGVADAAYDGLAALTLDGRAAFVAAAVERRTATDIEAMLGLAAADAARLVADARRQYLLTAARQLAIPGGTPPPEGPLEARIGEIARRALGGRSG